MPSGWSWAVVLMAVAAFAVATFSDETRTRYRRGVAHFSEKWLRDHTREARKSIDIVSGSLCPRVFNLWGEDILKRLEAIPGFRVRIVIGSEVLTDTPAGPTRLYKEAVAQKFGDRLQLRVYHGWPPQHFTLIDRRHLLVEDSHDLGAPEEMRAVTAIEKSRSKGKEFAEAFERLWKSIESSEQTVTFVDVKDLKNQSARVRAS